MYKPLLLKKSFYLKLFNAYITMLRNIAASRMAIGPLNSSKDKIITVLTPQAEFMAANIEIKQLQELFKARDTPISNNKPLLDN